MSVLINIYEQRCAQGILTADAQQIAALHHLQVTYDALLSELKKRRQLLSYFRQPQLVRGVYIWGGVGIGKTFLMDSFYEALALKEKWRIHFHQFMQYVHQELAQLQGKKNPLEKIAQKIARATIVLCFDELIVDDIGDAMILANLFQHLFRLGVTIITTANMAPDDLYQRGLQRQKFIPAIQLLKQHTYVLHMITKEDYRNRHLEAGGVFFTPNDAGAHEKMTNLFAALSLNHEIFYESILIQNRMIPIFKRTQHVIWFQFISICNIPRSQLDYLEIAEKFDTVLISDIPVMHSTNHLVLFIKLVDIFYAQKVRLILSAAKPIAELMALQHGIPNSIKAAYQRCASRLIEMQSRAYFLRS